MHSESRKILKKKTLESGDICLSSGKFDKIPKPPKNDTETPLDPVTEFVCSKCLLYQNCSASCEHIEEIYSRIGHRFRDDELIYTPTSRLSEDGRAIIRDKITYIIKEYLKEQEI